MELIFMTYVQTTTQAMLTTANNSHILSYIWTKQAREQLSYTLPSCFPTSSSRLKAVGNNFITSMLITRLHIITSSDFQLLRKMECSSWEIRKSLPLFYRGISLLNIPMTFLHTFIDESELPSPSSLLEDSAFRGTAFVPNHHVNEKKAMRENKTKYFTFKRSAKRAAWSYESL